MEDINLNNQNNFGQQGLLGGQNIAGAPWVVDVYPGQGQHHPLNPEENDELRQRIKYMDRSAGCKNGTRNFAKGFLTMFLSSIMFETTLEDSFSDLSRIAVYLGLSLFVASAYCYYGSNTCANEVGCPQPNYSCSNIDNCGTCARTVYSYLCPTSREEFILQ